MRFFAVPRPTVKCETELGFHAAVNADASSVVFGW